MNQATCRFDGGSKKITQQKGENELTTIMNNITRELGSQMQIHKVKK